MKDLKKHTIMRTVFFFSALLALAAVASAQDNGACTLAGLAGRWGYTITGTLILPTGPVPFAAVGRQTTDTEGHISATQTSVAGGAVSKDTLKGTSTVNSDCTGTITISVYDQSGNLLRTASWATVMDDNGREVRAIMTSLVLPNGARLPTAITLNAKRQFPNSSNEQ
jgi:hypothetical protein